MINGVKNIWMHGVEIKMVSFNTKKEAEEFARKRRKGFRKSIKKAEKDDWYSISPRRLYNRKRFLRASIKTVKVKKIQHKGWSKPLYEVVGR